MKLVIILAHLTIIQVNELKVIKKLFASFFVFA
jgi:hypothetical protein